MRIRDGTPTPSDWKSLLDRTPINATNAMEFQDAVRLFYDKQSVAKFNYEKLLTLQTPTATLYIHLLQLHQLHQTMLEVYILFYF